MTHPVFPLCHDLMEELAEHRPAAATMWGIPGHDHRWDDISPAGIASYRVFLEGARQRLQALPPATEPWDRLAYLPQADPTDGVGEARYLPAARAFLHDELDLDATYAWGWEAIHELHTDLVDVLSRVRPGASVAEAVEAFRSDPDTTSPDPDTFLRQVQSWQDDALDKLQDVLPVPLIARELSIERAPKGLPPGAWYMSPSEDGSRPGKVQYSLRDGPVPIFDQQSTSTSTTATTTTCSGPATW